MPSTTIDELSAALRARGQRVTPQRRAIAEVVRDLDGHATAEDIFGLADARIPGISLPTVYATLELLESMGIVRRLATEGGTAVFDGRTDEHHHLICRRCGFIADLDATADSSALLMAARSAGFEPCDVQAVISGLCARCAQPDAGP